MKTKFLSFLAFTASIALFYNCSSNDAIDGSTINSKSLTNEEPIEIGYADEEGNFIIYPDKILALKQKIEELFPIELSEMRIETAYTVDNEETGSVGGELYYVLRGNNTDESKNVAMKVDKVDNSFQLKPGTKLIMCRSTCKCKPQSYVERGMKYWRCYPWCESCTKEETVYSK